MNVAAAALVEEAYLANELVLVDDDKLTVEIVSWIVGKSPHSARLFVDASEALHYLKSSTPRLLVVDFYMPGMTGLDFIRELHESLDMSQVKVFLCSAVSPPGMSGAQFAAMGVEILEKQLICDRVEMVRLLDTYLIDES